MLRSSKLWDDVDPCCTHGFLIELNILRWNFLTREDVLFQREERESACHGEHLPGCVCDKSLVKRATAGSVKYQKN